MADTSDRSGFRQRLSARLFGGASGGVFRGMLTLALGSGAGRAIGIAAIPVLTRLYTPEDFGVLAVFTALVAILAPLVTLRYALALPLPRHDGVAMNLLVLSVVLMLGLSAGIAALLWIWGTSLLTLVSMEVLTPWWWLIALGVLGTASYELLTMWATRARAYRVIAHTSVTQSAAGALVKIGMGLSAVQPLGLLVGQVVAQTSGVGRLLGGFWSELRSNWRYVRMSRMRKVAWRHRGFPMWRVPSQFLMVFSMQAPMLITAAFFTASEVGHLSIALTLSLLPANILSQSLGKAYYAEAATLHHNPLMLYEATKSVFLKIFVISIILTAIFVTFAPILLPVILGSAWSSTGILTSILSLSLVAQMPSQSIINSLSIIGRNDIFMRINLSRFILAGCALSIPPAFGYSFLCTISIYTLAVSIQRFAQSYVVLRMLKTRVIRAETTT